MFKPLLQILIVQLALVATISTLVYLRRKRDAEAYNNGSFMTLSGVFDGGNKNTAVQMALVPSSNGSSEKNQTFNVVLDTTVDKMSISAAPMSYNAERLNKPASTIVSYDLNQQKPMITYGYPVSMVGNLTVLGDIGGMRSLNAPTVIADQINLQGGWIVAPGKLASGYGDLTVKNGQQAPVVTVTKSSVNMAHPINAPAMISSGNITTPDLNISKNGGCVTGAGSKVCFKDGVVNTDNISMNNANAAVLAAGTANIGGVKIGRRDTEGDKPKVVQTIDADLIELRNKTLLGLGGEINIGDFKLIEDRPARLSVFYKSKRVMELDATGSRSSDLYLYNQDDAERFVFMSSATSLLTKNARNDDKD